MKKNACVGTVRKKRVFEFWVRPCLGGNGPGQSMSEESFYITAQGGMRPTVEQANVPEQCREDVGGRVWKRCSCARGDDRL